ncbi:hypothetical protein [Brevibacillus sp. FIR094]|uniref:hypothetical protein n=1 Tax=Brevibacillus sp. FIR094 TaxID=3134809 RepID=UPI003D1AB202
MKYRQRNPDGTFGEPVETPGHAAGMSPEIQTAFETLAYMDMEMTKMKEEFMRKHEESLSKIAALEAEVQALKGGGQ